MKEAIGQLRAEARRLAPFGNLYGCDRQLGDLVRRGAYLQVV
jgi:hypothetical protein